MNKLKRFGRCFARKSIDALLYVGKYPMEIIELLSAVVLLMFGIYALIPMEIASAKSAYDNDIVKLIFGTLMLVPAVSLIMVRGGGTMEQYIYTRQPSRRKVLFWIAFTWFYIAVLRAVAIAVFPPIFLIYLFASLVTIICYIRLGN